MIPKDMYVDNNKTKRIRIDNITIWEKTTPIYVYSDGGQYINTGIMNTGNYIFEGRIKLPYIVPPSSAGDGNWIVGGRKTSSYTVGFFIGSSGVFNGYGSTTSAQKPQIVANTWYSYKLDMNGLTLTTDEGISNFYPIIGGSRLVPDIHAIEIRICSITMNWTGTGEDMRRMWGYHDYHKLTDANTGNVLYHYIAHADENNIGCFKNLVTDTIKYSDGSTDYKVTYEEV